MWENRNDRLKTVKWVKRDWNTKKSQQIFNFKWIVFGLLSSDVCRFASSPPVCFDLDINHLEKNRSWFHAVFFSTIIVVYYTNEWTIKWTNELSIWKFVILYPIRIVNNISVTVKMSTCMPIACVCVHVK